jgi:hypothetical protein
MAEREQHVFVVRIWREPSARGGTWRGSVHEPTSDRRIASTSLHDLWDFIAIRLRSTELPTRLREPGTNEEKVGLPSPVARSPNEQDPPTGSEPGRGRC